MFSFCYVRFNFFSVLSKEVGWEERLQNDLFCVRWDVKPQSVNSGIFFTYKWPMGRFFASLMLLVWMSPSATMTCCCWS